MFLTMAASAFSLARSDADGKPLVLGPGSLR